MDRADRVERFVEVGDGDRLWAEASGPADGTPMVLVMGANTSGLGWPDDLVDRLAARHRVIRYDHRDTGRSTWAFDERLYAIRDLAPDTVAVLDAFGVDRAHAVGMSMGGVLVQLLLLDHPPIGCARRPCSAPPRWAAGSPRAPAPAAARPATTCPVPTPGCWPCGPRWARPAADEEMAWRVAHWQLLNGDQLAVDPDVFRHLEQRVIDHTGRFDNPSTHARADPAGLERGAELAAVDVPTLVIEAPADPINPPPHATALAEAIGGARLVTIPTMGHALPPAVLTPLADAILTHTASVDRPGAG